jgi:SPASM domain peptide maturase of grasp-with-spasm system
MKYSKNDVFFVSSSCKLVKGAKRSIIIDYGRGDVQIIPNEYYDLVQDINRKEIAEVVANIDETSKSSFFSFIEYMLMNEFGFVTDEIEKFPEVSTALDDDHVKLKDAILEVDETVFDAEDFSSLIFQINELHCNDLQIRISSKTNYTFIDQLLSIIDKANMLFVELYLKNEGEITNDQWHHLLKTYAPLSHVHVYSANADKAVDYYIERATYFPIEIGKVSYHTMDFEKGCCGTISFDHLNFSDMSTHHFHQNHNGCLFKKLTIDKTGNIKNCPKMTKTYGNFKENRIEDVIQEKTYQALWNVKKDDIAICKDCEFRYNCSDCRAFTQDTDDEHSKPLRCGYNPYTNVWEDWSINPLKLLVKEH